MANTNFKRRREKKNVIDNKLYDQRLHALPQKKKTQWHFQWHSGNEILSNERRCTYHLKGTDASYMLAYKIIFKEYFGHFTMFSK